MFQIEPILWLQSFDAPGLAWFLSFVSTLGYTRVYVAMILVLVFGARLRPGLAVLAAMLLVGLLTHGLKHGLAFPRPDDIDARVAAPAVALAGAAAERGGAPSFWSLPDAQAVASFRAGGGDSFGIPSGHVSAATTFLLAVALFYRSRLALVLALGWIPLMGLSRMYLGRHFLADVLAGAAVGGCAVLLAAWLLGSLAGERALRQDLHALRPLAGVVLALLALTPFVALIDAENVGRLLALLASYAYLAKTDRLADEAPLPKVAARVAAAFALYLALSQLAGLAGRELEWMDTRAGEAAQAALLTGGLLVGTLALSRRFGWYRPE